MFNIWDVTWLMPSGMIYSAFLIYFYDSNSEEDHFWSGGNYEVSTAAPSRMTPTTIMMMMTMTAGSFTWIPNHYRHLLFHTLTMFLPYHWWEKGKIFKKNPYWVYADLKPETFGTQVQHSIPKLPDHFSTVISSFIYLQVIQRCFQLLDYEESNGWICSYEWWSGKDLGGNSNAIIEVLPQHLPGDCKKQRKSSVMTADALAKVQTKAPSKYESTVISAMTTCKTFEQFNSNCMLAEA